MSGATIFVVGMTVLLLAYGIAMWLLFRDNVVVRPSREPSEFQKLAIRLSESMKAVQREFAIALTPALQECVRAMNRFHAAMTKDEQNTGERP